MKTPAAVDAVRQPDTSQSAAAMAVAHPNIALVKYWGKRAGKLNLPAAGSLSITLDALETRTAVRFDPALQRDVLELNDQQAPAGDRVCACLDVLRQQAGRHEYAHIRSHNNFPTAAGLASSASGFAALVVAATQALGLPLERRHLSTVARQGSGSAARSLFGGFALMHAGTRSDGCDAYAEPLLAAGEWPLEVVVAITTAAAKGVASAAGMEASRLTSPFYPAWVNTVAGDLRTARTAVAARDFAALGTVAEHSCLKMHAVMLSTQPALWYWNAATVACMQRVRELREHDGLGVFFTVDAGPQVKAVCAPGLGARVADILRAVPGVVDVMRSGLGEGAAVVAEAA